MAELAAGGDLEKAMASEAISSQLKRLTQNWTICVQAIIDHVFYCASGTTSIGRREWWSVPPMLC